ncbi:BTAD domain-containing putative transcriptional regulator [Amycolatopsis sp. WQ 127309]|uniref:BTAD domain-containing putative transcriptional regulator n=1 Tax=Amycolatopsis sp. WQ 127309 TaxID=2932773 RepID=UPI001FF47E18|nr:BTAD domain-containing putative transcriptional regulator [Amycolatopsis sp. WQ 127309]UOZ03408.1 LysM peptidoglycan-binding domain-containing protein [Amycolatopsis sp. WQ 127309]
MSAAVLLLGLVAGLPWALIGCVGWPLPDHLLHLDEIGAALMAPMSKRFLLDILACLDWGVWLVFVADVVVCTVDALRGTPRRAGTWPFRRVAAVLVGTLLLALLSRTADAAPISSSGGQSVAGPLFPSADATASPGDRGPKPSPPSPAAGTERVRAPDGGVHDTLWRIAQRCLGDGDRWPEIWALNRGSVQPGGRALSNPNVIHPGDVLRLPVAPPTARPAAPSLLPQEDRHDPQPPASVSPSQPSPQAPGTPRPASGVAHEGTPGAVTWGSGEVFVGLTLAAAVSTLLLVARRRRHTRYRPGSGRRQDDPPVTPVVYQLRLAHLDAQQIDDEHAAIGSDDPPDGEAAGEPQEPVPDTAGRLQLVASRGHRLIGTPPLESSSSTVDIAVEGAADRPADREVSAGVDVAIDLASAHGLGLVGPGGYAAARALLLTVLTALPGAGSSPSVLVPSADLGRLLGTSTPAPALPVTVEVTADLDTALAEAERRQAEPSRATVLVTSPPHDSNRQARLQHLLDNGARGGITALLLGQWRPGVTAYITAGGIISATNPGLGEPLRGSRAFTLPDSATRELLAFLRATQNPTGHPSELAGEEPASRTHPAEAGRLEITARPTPVAVAGERGDPDSPSVKAAVRTLVMTVFGPPTLHWRPEPDRPDDLRDMSGELTRRLVELLVLLAVHPTGISRNGIIDALWPAAPPRNPASVLRTVLSRIRRAVYAATEGAADEAVLVEHGHYRLDPAVVDVDYWHFADAVAGRRTSGPGDRHSVYEAIIAAYGGPLADGLDAEWLVAAREATRRDAMDAVAALARARVDDDPDYTLDLLETARSFDPHNELLYRDIMRLQHLLGRHDAISRTLTLLQTRLAELDITPTAETLDLAHRLRGHHASIANQCGTGPRIRG